MTDRERQQALASAANKLAKLFSCANNKSEQTLVVCASDGLERLTNEELLVLQTQITAQLTRNLTTHRLDLIEVVDEITEEPTYSEPAEQTEPEPKPEPKPTNPNARIYLLFSRFQEVNYNYDLLRSALELEATDLQLAHTVRKYKLPKGGDRAANIEKLVQYVKTSRAQTSGHVEEKPIKPTEPEPELLDKANWLDMFGEL